MTHSEQTIETEVVEIDGIAMEPNAATPHQSGSEWKQWRTWSGHLGKLDARWWPLWAFLGFIALVVAVAVGMCLVVVIVSYKFLRSLVTGILSLFLPSHELQRR